jgi:2-oxoglutarate dehydrogenase E2 component (dihydrolipoamide succinyltransferase)
MPHLGESVAEGTILEWLKKEGEAVERDEPLLAISTEKVDAEVPSPAAGILARILVQIGESVACGSTVAVIEPRAESREPRPGAEAQRSAIGDQRSAESAGAAAERSALSPTPSASSDSPTPSASASGAPTLRGSDAPTPRRPDAPAPTPPIPRSPDPSVPPPPRPSASAPVRFYSPAVLRLAQESHVNLDAIQGTGEGGRVTKRDVERLVAARASQAPPAGAAREEVGEEIVPLTKIRRTIAERMLRSVQTAPHATTVVEADFTAIARFRNERQAAFQHAAGVKLTFLPFVVKVVAHVLREFPTVNARWGEDAIRVQRAIHLGIAVAMGDALAVPVLRSPGSLPVSEIAVRLAGLIARAREGRLQPEELTGSTFTVNNFGADGNLIGTPILNQPEVGILGLGSIEKRPVVVTRDGEDVIAIRSMGYLCLSFDHRVLDGATAGRFLQTLRRTIESFRVGEGIWVDPRFGAEAQGR